MRVCLKVIRRYFDDLRVSRGLDRLMTTFGACPLLHFLLTIPRYRTMQSSLNSARRHGAWIIVVSSVDLPIKKVQSSELAALHIRPP